jgi:Tol biopolymer transport system component
MKVVCSLQEKPVPIIEGVGIFSASNGFLAYLTELQISYQLAWLDAKGNAQSISTEVGNFGAIALSPNADRAAVVKIQGLLRPSRDIWLVDLLGGRQERFTFGGAAPNGAVLWSGDGKHIVYSVIGPSGTEETLIYRRPADRSSDAEVLFKSSGVGYVSSWSPDGRFLLRTVRDLKTNNADIRIISLESRTESSLIATPAVEVDGRFSRDGKWIAYFSDESSRNEVYVRSFNPGTASEPPRVGPPLLASKGGPSGALGGGIGPFWRGDSKALAYPSPSGWMTVELTTNSAATRFGEPQPFLSIGNQQRAFDVTSEFQRALVVQPLEQSATAPATVILNWQQLLKK